MRIIKPGLWPILLLFAFAPGGCGSSAPQSGLPTAKMKIGSRDFVLELALTEQAQHKGLMQRDFMDTDHGMLFVFTIEDVQQFWMKDTRFPLDILFLDHNGKIISISQMKPYDLNTTASGGPAKYAIELNQGAAAEAGVKVGDTLDVPSKAREPQDTK